MPEGRRVNGGVRLLLWYVAALLGGIISGFVFTKSMAAVWGPL